MKKTVILSMLILLAGCGENHFIQDAAFRSQVQQDFKVRTQSGNLSADMVLPQGITLEEKEALEFLYAYMPLADITDYPATFHLQMTRAALRTREEQGWKVPEREFRHFVLPVRVNNEALDSARLVFHRELAPRIQGMGMQEAILEVNHWCHEKVTYQPSDARTSSPLNLMKNALGRCGEESTFCVTALRSVGIPARQVYTPRWAHTDDNHAWVEAWADGQWWFLGACEPEPVLNLGWFNAPASRAMLMHTKVFGKYDGPEEVVLQSPNYTEVNLIDNYTQTARIDFQVLWGPDTQDAGKPVEGARVDFCIYNYAEFYPAVSKYTGQDGRTFISAGLGDMLVWASQGPYFGFTKVSFGKQREATVVLRYCDGHKLASPVGVQDAFDLVPPPENVQLPEVTPAQRAENDRRFAYEDSLRHAYEATFPTQEEALAFVRANGYEDRLAQALVRARSNAQVIRDFMAGCPDHQRVEEIFNSLSTKDFHDITLPLLYGYYTADPFFGSRVEDEFLTDYYSYFQSHPGSEATVEGIQPQLDPTAWRIPMSPEGVWRSGLADSRSLDIYTVALLRARGQDARKNPITGTLETREAGGDWKALTTAPGKADPKGVLRLTYQPIAAVDNPQYYTHFTLSKLVEGRPRLLSFDEGEVDMGGGTDWANSFKKGCVLDEGTYLLVSGSRLPDGSVPVSMSFFSVEEGKETVAELRLADGKQTPSVIGQIDAAPYLPLVGDGPFVLALLEPGKEPTNHALRDLSAAREALEAWGRPILLYCSSEEALAQLHKEKEEGRYGELPATVLFGVLPEGTLEGTRPVVLLSDSQGRVYFRSEGYTIGLGNQLSAASTALK